MDLCGTPDEISLSEDVLGYSQTAKYIWPVTGPKS